MFRILRCLFDRLGKPPDKLLATRGSDSNHSDDFALLNRVAPLQTTADQQNFFVRREAILDRAEKIAGYQFSLLTTLKTKLHQRGGMARRTYDASLLGRLASDGVTSLLGNRLAFVSLSAESLSNALIDRLPPQNTVLILEVAQLLGNPDATGVRLAELKQKGFLLGLAIHDATDVTCPLTSDLDFIQIDVTAFDGIDLRSLTSELNKSSRAGVSPPRLVARDVQSHDDFQFCIKCGFDYFQGPFVTSRESFKLASGGVNRVTVLPILNMVRNDTSFALIADQLKNEPTLSYKLLRYLNSPAMGLQQPVDNLTQALVLIGREKFYRWMSLLLFEFANPSYRERSLAERALVRGRTLELLSGKGNIPNGKDHLFLVGLFSLLDEALGRPLPELLGKATLPDAVRDALLGKPGAYADALAIAVLGEADTITSPDRMAQALQRCGIDDTAYATASAEALIWASQALGDPA